jgi:CBS domain-containing protein
MKRWLYSYDRVLGIPERLDHVLRHRVRDLVATVSDGQRADVLPDGDLLVRLPAHVLGLDLHKMVRIHTGVAERRDTRTIIPVRWHADPGRQVFPSFDGTIELESQSRSSAHITIVGAATLPLGPVGGAVDTTVLGSVAERTIRYVASGLATALERAAAEAEPEEQAAPADGLRVGDVMTPSPLALTEDMPLKTAALLLFHYEVAGAPVRSGTGGLVGVLSEADLLDAEAPLRYGPDRDAEASRRRWAARTVGEACSRPAREVAVTASVRQAAELMRDHDIARLIVVDGSEVAGVISRHDVLKALLRTDVEIKASLDRMLAELGEAHVTAAVDWSIASLSGQASTRSRVSELRARVEDVDGVVSVDSDLTWEIDDVLPGATTG